jgi:hypothetical protein
VQPAARRKIDRVSIDSRVRGTSLPKHAQGLGPGWWRVRLLLGCVVGVMEWMGSVSCQVCLQQQHSENPQIYPSIATVQSIATMCSRSRKLHLACTSSSADGVFEIVEVVSEERLDLSGSHPMTTLFEDWVCRVDPEYILRIGMISIEPTYFLMPERDSHCWKHPQLLQVVVHSATE